MTKTILIYCTLLPSAFEIADVSNICGGIIVDWLVKYCYRQSKNWKLIKSLVNWFEAVAWHSRDPNSE